MDKLEIKEWLDAGGSIDYSGDQSEGHIFKSKLTKMYCYMFNAKIIIAYKTFKTFITELDEINKKHQVKLIGKY